MSRRTTAPTVQLKQHSRVSCTLTGPWCDGALSALQEEKGYLPSLQTTWGTDNMAVTLSERTSNLAFPPFLPENLTTFRTLVSDIGCTFSQPLESQQINKTRCNLFSELLRSTVYYHRSWQLHLLPWKPVPCLACRQWDPSVRSIDKDIPLKLKPTQFGNSLPITGSCSHELIHRLR